MKRSYFVAAATVLLFSGIGYGAVDLNLSSDAGPVVVNVGSTTSIPFDVYVTDTGVDSLAGYNVGITLTAVGTAATFKPGLGAAVNHTDIIPDQLLSGGISNGELLVGGYAPGANEQYPVLNNGGLFSFDLLVPSLGVGMYTLSFDPAMTFLSDNSGLVTTGSMNGVAVTVVSTPEPAAVPIAMLLLGSSITAVRHRPNPPKK